MPQYFLGLDSSTQSLSAVVIDLASRKVVCERSLNFDQALPQYGTRNGVLRHQDPQVVHAPPLLWVEALDRLCTQMKKDGLALEAIVAVSGSGQQHGSVYLNESAPARLAGLDPAVDLCTALEGAFSRATSPIWMDSSTAVQCREITAALGGTQAVAAATGSAAFERFTGPQIRKFHQQEPQAYGATAHIALVSSFLCSLMSGRIAPIDPGDGAGMNLMDIRSKQWHAGALAATAPELARKLPPLAPSDAVVGPLSPYFVRRYGFSPACVSVVWSGDNPCSVIGLGLVKAGQVAISLGTSDTYFGTMAACRVDERGEGHVFGSPNGDYMTLICFKNGSLAREQVRDQYSLDWAGFSAALLATKPGNQGGLMLPWFEPEIVPRVLQPGVHRRHLAESDAAANCRAVVEAQMMSMRLHSAWMGVRPSVIHATGGGASNRQVLQIMADVQGCPVECSEVGKSAALGAALRAAQAWLKKSGRAADWTEVVAGFTASVPGSRIEPDPAAVRVYDRLVGEYAEFEKSVLA